MTTIANVVTGGVRLHSVQQGPAAGPAIIMLHGYSDSSFSFSRILPLLPPPLRVIVPDQRGHGHSDRAADYSMDAMAGDVLELMNALDVPAATVVGHSMGSFVARRLAVLAPDRIRRLLLVGAGPSARNEAVLEVQRGANALEDPVDPAFVSDFQYSTIHQPVPEAFMEKVVAESLTLDAATWKAVIAGLLAYTPAESDIRAPTLVLGGEKDAVFTVEEQRALARRIDGATVEILEGLGHAPHWEDPKRFVGPLIRFLYRS